MNRNFAFRSLLVIAVTAGVGMIPTAHAQGMMDGGMMMGGGMMGSRGNAAPAPGNGTADTGQALFQSHCAMCHTVAAGAGDRFGPNLHGLFGRKAGTGPSFSYSTAMRESGVVWNGTTLDHFLADPAKIIPGNRMPFAGLKDGADRQALVTYLERATR